MARFNEVRPFEGMWAPLKARLELRKTFKRWLAWSRQPHFIVESEEIVDELCLLELCQHYRLEYPGCAGDIAKTWDESEDRVADGGPQFADLESLDWVFFDGGRWIMQSTPLGTSSDIIYPSQSTKTFLTGLGKVRLVARTDNAPASAQKLVVRILAGDLLDRNILTKRPDWLTGRLWEWLCPKPQPSFGGTDDEGQIATIVEDEVSDAAALIDVEDVDKAFVEWSAWCAILGAAGRWDVSWSAVEMSCCRDAAHRVLDRQNLWGTWANDTTRYAEVLTKTFGISEDSLRYSRTPRVPPPRTLVSRSDWLAWPEVEHLMMQRLDRSTVGFAFGLLCSELDKTDIGPSITASAAAVISFMAAHPMALQLLLLWVDNRPALLVDLLIHQGAACLGTKLAIEWRAQSRPSSDQQVSREAQTKAFAIQDALSLLAHHLDKRTLDLEEYASLVTWCYAGASYSNKAVADSRGLIGQQLLGMVARKSEDTQLEVLQHLVSQAAYQDNLSRARFAAVLEGLNILTSASGVDISPIVALYAKFAHDLHLEWTDVSSLPGELAVRLVATALSHTALERDALLRPIDSAKVLRNTPDKDKLSVSSSIARTLRTHVRLLARAVASWPDGAVPPELCDALEFLISRSVIEHTEKGRVGALTDRYSPNLFWGREEGTPAQDLTAAWRRLSGNRQDAMLDVFAQSDDPVLLAELCEYLPAAAKPIIRKRLRQLKPEEASAFWTWPELQRRISSLLVAGEYELAREHLDMAQRDVSHIPPQYQLVLFGLELQIFLGEKNWGALDSAVVPQSLDEATTRQARDQLDFYRATSQLMRPNGNLPSARVLLQRLAARPGAAPAYKENVFAIAIQQLMGKTLQPLRGPDKVIGEGLLAEMNAAVSADEEQAHANLLANRALLLLALQRPKDALDSITLRREMARSLDLEITAVLAKSEMGLHDEAMAILDAAISEFGDDDRLTAVKNDLQTGGALQSVTSPSLSVDLISSIRVALQQLAELPPSDVGDILGPPGGGIQGYLTRQVSKAVAALQHMAAMLRDRKNSADDAKFENDLNTAVREVLGASLAMSKWDVIDQSLGGTTLNGTPGERDIVIRMSGQEIAIYEALVCTGLNRPNTKSHFDKLLSYGLCDIYFHVTYSYAKSVEPLLDYLRDMLENDLPSGYTYIRCAPLEPSNYATRGYSATYQADHREVTVVFLIADLKVPGRKAAQVGDATS